MTKIAVALSGGLDSSVAAFLLLQQGYEVVGITGKMLSDTLTKNIVDNAKKVADFLGIPHYIVDTTEIFNKSVINYFDDSYKKGNTPNPCIMCNKFIKWGVLSEYAINTLNADYYATGHYANIKKMNGHYRLYPAEDSLKDQLYFLFLLNQNQLSKTLFPLSNYKKTEIRKIAEENNLPTKSSKESQDICFIKKPMTTKKYLISKLMQETGNFVHIKKNQIIGHHTGYFQYTIGQRKGIGIAAEKPLYVVKIDAKNNIVYVGEEENLKENSLIINSYNETYPIPDTKYKALVKIRYNMKSVPAIIEKSNVVTVKFQNPISSISKGQACVIYDKNDGHLLGGGFIE